MRLGRDTKTLIVMGVAVALLGWFSHVATRAVGPPPPLSGAPPIDAQAQKWAKKKHPGPWNGPGFPGSPPQGAAEITPLRLDDPLLVGRTLERWAPDRVVTVRVNGPGYLCTGLNRGPDSGPAALFTRQAQITIARHDGDLTETASQGHLLPVRRIPTDATTFSISPDGLVLAFRRAPESPEETCMSCGYIELTMFEHEDALVGVPGLPDFLGPTREVGNVTSGRPGQDGRGTLVVTP